MHGALRSRTELLTNGVEPQHLAGESTCIVRQDQSVLPISFVFDVLAHSVPVSICSTLIGFASALEEMHRMQ